MVFCISNCLLLWTSGCATLNRCCTHIPILWYQLVFNQSIRLAKKFIWVFHTILWENSEELPTASMILESLPCTSLGTECSVISSLQQNTDLYLLFIPHLESHPIQMLWFLSLVPAPSLEPPVQASLLLWRRLLHHSPQEMIIYIPIPSSFHKHSLCVSTVRPEATWEHRPIFSYV